MINKIAILGDFNPVYETHHKLNESVRDLTKLLGTEMQFDWIATDIFNCQVVFEKQKYTGLWIAPGSPYKDMENALNTITYTREHKIPTLGNCGGFQHMVIEFAKNVCDIKNADHEETNPDSAENLIERLSCSLKGTQEHLEIIDEDSILYRAYKTKSLIGKYFCSYGLNNKYLEILQSKGMKFTSKSEDGHYRSFEIDSHPFFMGTLFQPALTSTSTDSNPIIIEFINRCLEIETATANHVQNCELKNIK